MFNRIFTRSALATVLLGLGVAASAEEAPKSATVQPGAVVMPGMMPGFAGPFGPYGLGGPFGPYGGGMYPGMFPSGPGMFPGAPGMYPGGLGGPMMGPGGFGPSGQTPYQTAEEREQALAKRLGREGQMSRREYHKQRRQQRQAEFERQAARAGMPMMRPQAADVPSAPTGYGSPGDYGRSPYGSSRRDVNRARRESRQDFYERELQAAQSRQPTMPGMTPYGPMGMGGPGGMPGYGPMGMGGPGMPSSSAMGGPGMYGRPDPWAPMPGEE